MNNNTIKKGILAFFILSAFILTGYIFVNFQNTEYISDIEKNTQIYSPATVTDTNNSISENTSIYYILKNESNILNLYEIKNNDKILIKSSPINTDFLPTEDISSLEKGIIIKTLEDGYQLIEDFTS